MPAETDPFMDTEGVATHLGLSTESVRIYLKRTRARVAAELPVRPQDFPLPDETFGRSPAWKQSTIETWRANRPGRGRRGE